MTGYLWQRLHLQFLHIRQLFLKLLVTQAVGYRMIIPGNNPLPQHDLQPGRLEEDIVLILEQAPI